MKVTDLIAIGKLGNKLNSKGYIFFRKKDKSGSFSLPIKDVFLLFTDHRVRYVTIEDEQDGWILLEERDLMQEAALDGNVQVMIAPEDYQTWNEVAQIEPFLDYQAVEKDVIVGKICDYITRPMQNLFEIEQADGKTFYVPDSLPFVISIDKTNKVILFSDLTELKLL
jgi:ribosomal 30S subunit maturation factor RimM